MTGNPPPPDVATPQRILAFVQTGFARIADSVRPIDAGVVLSTPSLPALWPANQLRVTAPLPFAAIVALADEQLAGFDYRHIVVEDQSAGPELEAAFRARAGRSSGTC